MEGEILRGQNIYIFYAKIQEVVKMGCYGFGTS